MTAQVAIFNLSGVAVASDSITTVSRDERIRTFSGAQKLFDLGANHRVVVMISGESRFMQVPYGVLLPTWRDTLTDPLPTITDYAEHFTSWLTQQTHLFDSDHQSSLWSWLLQDYYLAIRASIRRELHSRELTDLPWDDLSVSKVVTTTVERFITQLSVQEEVTDVDIAKDLAFVTESAEVISEAFEYVFDDTPRTIETDQVLLSELPPLLLAKQERWSLDSTVAIIGYGTNDTFPRHQTLELTGIVDNRLRYTRRPHNGTELSNRAIVAPFAQSEAIDTFLRAYNVDFPGIAHDRLDATLDAVLDLVQLTEEQLESVATIRSDAHKTLRRDIEDYSSERFISPMLATVESLPHGDMARMAEALVGIQALRAHSSDHQPSVGGNIALLTINPETGVTWHRHHA